MRRLIAACACAVLFAPAHALHAQEGAGSTGAQVLQITAGARAAALSGAYTAGVDDPDVLFYNPAGLASFRGGAAVSYARLVDDVALTTGAASFHAGAVSFGLAAALLNEGSVNEIVPDPAYGGQRGIGTGRILSASEGIGRLGAAFDAGRLRIGAAAGFVSSSVAGETRSAPVFDAGAQVDVAGGLTVGAGVRNVGSSLGGDAAEDARLPAEARAGATFAARTVRGIGLQVSADLISRFREKTTGFAAGVEAGLLPSASRVGAVARVGYTADTDDAGLAPLRLGASVSLGPVSFDYTYQNFDFFGATHSFGLRYIAR